MVDKIDEGVRKIVDDYFAEFRKGVSAVTALTNDRDEWKLQHENLLSVRQQDLQAYATLEDERDRLKLEVERLRDALTPFVIEGIEIGCDECGGVDDQCPTDCNVRCGRAALAGGEGT